ncbi:MAG: hypothetical protein AABZ39_04145 [Spirochaetota bacterium]
MDEYIKFLDSAKPAERIKGLDMLASADLAGEERLAAIRKLKDMILDWDENVQTKVSEVLTKLTGT